MGKIRKVPAASKDEAQKKISSFFQKSTEIPGTVSKLFSEVGTKTGKFATKVSPPTFSKSKENKSPSAVVTVISDDAESDEFAPAVKKIRSPTFQTKVRTEKPKEPGSKTSPGHAIRQISGKNGNGAGLDAPKVSELLVVPETQFFFTPENKLKKCNKKTEETKKSTPDSPKTSNSSTDFGIIPDTPDSNDISVKPKRPLGRSFLLSATSLASNPIQKAKENREAKLALKKKAVLARKSSGPVSVEFNKERSVSSETEKKFDGFVQESSVGSINAKSDAKGTGNGLKLISPDKSETETDIEDKTPTKIYANSETSAIKRMAKPGISPASKRTDDQKSPVKVTDKDDTVRILSFDLRTNQNGVDRKETNACDKITGTSLGEFVLARKMEADSMEPFGDVIEFEKHKQEMNRLKKERLEIRRLELLKEQRKKEKELRKKNHEKLVNYQLTGDASSHKTPSCVRERAAVVESVENDDTLEDLLLELKSPSLLKSDSKPKKMDSISKPVFKPASTGSLSKEAKTLTETRAFSDHCDIEIVCDNMTVLKSKPLVTSHTISLESNDRFGCMVAEWTDEDENFFKKLGMSTETTDVNKTKNTCDENVNKLIHEDLNDSTATNMPKQLVDKTNALEIMPPVKLKPDSKPHFTSKKLDTSAKSKSGSSTDTQIDIKEFQSQESAKSSSSKDRVENDIAMFSTPVDQIMKEAAGSRSQEEMEIDEFGSQLDSQLLCDDFEHLTPFKESKGSSEMFQTEAPCSEFGRHIVTAVEQDSEKHETTLTLATQPGDLVRKCVLHGFWLDSHVQAGDLVNVLARFQNNICHITDTEGLLIVTPDILLSGTTVVSSVFCMRKSILKEKFKGCDSGNIHMLFGSIIHSVFQQVLRKQLLTEEAILQEAERIVRQTSNLLEIYGNKVTEDKVMEEIVNYLPQTIGWTKQHTNIGQDIFGNQRKTKPDILMTKVSDIEENIWSPRYGIKGKIDLTVEAQLKNGKSRKIVPLELKTGKTTYSVEHKGQVTLYSMMCSDRREDPGCGLLLYLKEPSMKVIPADRVNQKGLIQLRNEMAYYISRQVVKTTDKETQQTTFNLGRLPEPITNIRACQKCPQLINCAIYQREVEGRQARSNEMSGLVDDTLRHLTSRHMMYFTQWGLMLDLESQKDQQKRTVADIWCKSSVTRYVADILKMCVKKFDAEKIFIDKQYAGGIKESVGECLSGMVLSGSLDDHGGNNDDDSMMLTFQRHKDSNIITPLSSIGLNVQDSVVISCEKPSWIAVCTGFVQEITATAIQILIDREGSERLFNLKSRVLRIDKCDNFSTAGIYYTNVSRLMTDDSHCQKLRSLIIDRVKPEFLNTLSKGNIEKVKSIFKSLNKPQKTAVLKVLMSKDYVLIKGYPGTGKTSTIVALVKVLSVLGYSVLLTSYTHSAVDNILLKLKKDHVKFLRLGRISKIHPDVREFSVDKLTQRIKTTSQLEEFLHSQTIVATSCLGTNHPLFTRRQFDICIVDEASQVVQPACLGPLFCCKKFVLVGDPKQLPPVVQSKEARDLGMDESLFMRLENTGATFDLNLQYRMNSDIMYLSNQLVYNGCLKCGSDSVAERVLQLPNRNNISTQVIKAHPWLSEVVDDNLNKSVVFLDTEKASAPEEKSQAGTLQNPTEAHIVLKIVHTLVMGGVDPDEIGIIAPYRSQVFLIRSRLSEGEGHWRSKVEVNTVDQYQGRDKSVIVISFVRSSKDQENLTGELLKDIRRLNVALTRAKVKLILMGNILTLRHYPPLKDLIQILKDRSHISFVKLFEL